MRYGTLRVFEVLCLRDLSSVTNTTAQRSPRPSTAQNTVNPTTNTTTTKTTTASQRPSKTTRTEISATYDTSFQRARSTPNPPPPPPPVPLSICSRSIKHDDKTRRRHPLYITQVHLTTRHRPRPAFPPLLLLSFKDLPRFH